MVNFTVSESIYNKKTRVRVCGLLEKDDSILLLKHKGIGKGGYLWSPPGGGIQFEEKAEKALIREFKEETNLDIEIIDFLFVNEYKDEKYHAIELFFSVKALSNELIIGSDPEVPDHEQILTEVKYWKYKDIRVGSNLVFHNCFSLIKDPKNVLNLRGFFNFENI